MKAVAMLLLGLASASALATSNLGFLHDGPMAKFQRQDYALLAAALQRSYAAEAGSEPAAWRNDATGASGEVRVERVFERGTLPCRELRITNRQGRLESTGVYTVCQRDGRWKLAS